MPAAGGGSRCTDSGSRRVRIGLENEMEREASPHLSHRSSKEDHRT